MKSWQVALRRWYAWRASTVACEPTFRTKPRKLLENLTKNGHKVAMCPNLRAEWKKHKSLFATRWLASMVAKKKVVFLSPSEKIKNIIDDGIEECKDKEIALKDAHLVDAALEVDKIIASNDNRARNVFCKFSRINREICAVSWFNAVSDSEFIIGTVMVGGFIPNNYSLREENIA